MGKILKTQANIIEFEGIDGAGKATQVASLKKYLENLDKQVAVFEFPRHEQPIYGQLVDQYLNGNFGDPTSLNPYFSSLLFSADRYEVKSQILQAQLQNDYIIFDRYVISNWAHQTVKFHNQKEKNDYLNWAKDLEFNQMQLPVPDKVIILKIPFNGLLERIKQKKNRHYIKGILDKHENNLNYLKAVQKEYLRIAKQKKEWQIIDCSGHNQILPPEIIFKKILKTLNLN